MLARLLPDGYRDDPDAAGEFRKYTEPALRSAKHQAAQEMLDTLPDAGGRIQLTQDQALSWLKALNDIRLALGVRLGVTEEFEEQWGAAEAGRPAVDRVRGIRLARRGAGVARAGPQLIPALDLPARGPLARGERHPRMLFDRAHHLAFAVRQGRGPRPRRPPGRGLRRTGRPGRELTGRNGLSR